MLWIRKLICFFKGHKKDEIIMGSYEHTLLIDVRCRNCNKFFYSKEQDC